MTDNIEWRMKYMRLIEAIRRTMPPVDIDDGPVKRGVAYDQIAGGTGPFIWKMDHDVLSKAVAGEMMHAIRLKVMAEKAGNARAKDRASGRIAAITDDWCGTMGSMIVLLNPQPLPPRDWWWDDDPIRRRDDLVSAMLAEIGGLQPGPVVDAAQDIALQLMMDQR